MANCKLLYLFDPKNVPPIQVLSCCTDWENPLDSSQTGEGDIGNENMSAVFNYIHTDDWQLQLWCSEVWTGEWIAQIYLISVPTFTKYERWWWWRYRWKMPWTKLWDWRPWNVHTSDISRAATDDSHIEFISYIHLNVPWDTYWLTNPVSYRTVVSGLWSNRWSIYMKYLFTSLKK